MGRVCVAADRGMISAAQSGTLSPTHIKNGGLCDTAAVRSSQLELWLAAQGSVLLYGPLEKLRVHNM
jgi:hypothetical protein